MGIKIKGIDVSYANGLLDKSKWQKIKADGIGYAILRAGYGGEDNQKDAQFENNYKIAKEIGMPIGAYHYSYAKTVDRVKVEAKTCIKWLKGKKFEYPIYFDIEDSSQSGLSKSLLTAMTVAFCEEIKKAGYIPGVYASKSWLTSKLDYAKISKYSIWCAQYYSSCTLGKSHDMWQYTEDGKVDGLSGKFDLNWCYKDFGKGDKPPKEEESTTDNKLEKKTSGIVTVSKKAYGNCEVTNNFKLYELACNDGSDSVKFSWRTINWLQDMRTFFGHSVKITSAYRTPSWNIKQGGASKSKHTEGKAIDHFIIDDPYPVTLIAKFYETKGIKGIICYTGQGFVHVDSRGFDGDWSGKYYSYNDKTSVSTFLKTVKQGSSGQDVKDLQLMLKKHGYKLTVDGVFGKDTHQMVEHYQKQVKLTADGIVGAATWKKLLTTTTQEGKDVNFIIGGNDVPEIDISSYPTLKQNSKQTSADNYVLKAQKALIKKGYSCGNSGADGYFGAGTTTAVKKFQKASKLTADGIIGQNTWKQLMK